MALRLATPVVVLGLAAFGCGSDAASDAAKHTATPENTPTMPAKAAILRGSFQLTSQELAVASGQAFNIADDYFNDGLIPPTPVANFGCHAPISVVAAADGSLDIAWLDYTDGQGSPWATKSPGMIYLTHVDPTLATAATQATGVSSYKLLGFTEDAAGDVYLAYNKDHRFKSDTKGDPNQLNGNELHVTKLSGGAPVWDQLIFGDRDNQTEGSLGDPGGAASGVLGYDSVNQKLVLYLGHTMMWTGIRHQAGFLRLLEPDSGEVLPPAGDDITHFGAGWFYSHNCNQRLLIDEGSYYLLAHGDSYARQLGFARWSPQSYTNDNDADFNAAYFRIDGKQGDNKTDAQTGQFVKMADGSFLIAHTTAQGRKARDVRLALADGSIGESQAHAVWLTENTGTTQATMPKVERLGDDVLVTYALWDSSAKHELTWYGALVDASLQIVAPPQVLSDVEFVDSAPLFRFPGGPNAGRVGWVSGNASHTLSVHMAALQP